MKKYCLLLPVLVIIGCFYFSSASLAAGQTSVFFGKMYAGDGGQANEAYLDMPKGFTFGSRGDLFIADTADNVIRRIGTNGIITTYAGGGEYGRHDGTLLDSTFSEPEGIAYADGILYVADTGASKIRKIIGNSVITLPIVGINRPSAVVVSGSDLYICSWGNGSIYKTSINGGTLNRLVSGLNNPLKIAYHDGIVYVAENGSGNILAINATTKTKSNVATGFTEPRAITYYEGYLYVTAGPSGMYNEIWKINPANGDKEMLVRRVETELLNQSSDMLIGSWSGSTRILMLQSGGSSIQSTDINGQDLQLVAGKHRYGDEMGAASSALLGRPQELVSSPDGTKLYISYEQGNKIAEYNLLSQQVRMIAGYPMDNYREGTGGDARFSDATSMVITPDGLTLYLVDRNSQRIRSVDIATGTTHYLTGAGVINLINPITGNIDVTLSNGYQEGGPCADTYDLAVSGCAYFSRPTGIAINKKGDTLYIADSNNQRIRKVNIATGQTSLIAGSGNKGFINGVGAAASFRTPFTLTLSADEKYLYVVDKGNNAVRQIALANNKVTTLAGTGQQGYREGAFATALFSIPEYIELGPDGNLYLAEAGSLRVRKLDLTRRVTSLVSGSGERGKRDGVAEVSEWSGPKGMAFLNDHLIVADFKNDLLRQIDLSGQVPILPATSVNHALYQFYAFDKSWRSGFSVSAGDVNGDGTQELVAGSGAKYLPLVRIFSLNGTLIKQFSAYANSIKTGVKVAACDLNADGKSEIVTAPGKGSVPHIRIFNSSGQLIGQFFALNGKFKGGVSLACGDVTGDGKAEIVVAASTDGGPQVTVHSLTGKILSNFMAYNKSFRGGIQLGLADTDGNGVKEIIAIPYQGKANVLIYSGSGRKQTSGFFAYPLSYNDGGTITGADVNGDGVQEILVSPGSHTGNETRIFTRNGFRVTVIRAFPKAIKGYLSIYGSDVDGDGEDELITVPGSLGAPQLRIIDII